MTDKVQKIRAFLVGIADADWVSTILAKAIEKKILPYIDSLQEEPVSGLDNGDMSIERWKQAVAAASNQKNYRSSKGFTETRDDYFVDGVQWADEHPLQKPMEWSKEDDEHLQIAINYTFSGGYLSTVDWLKSLKNRILPQPKSEWSEEDKKRINHIIQFLEDRWTDNERAFPIEEDVRWLKSLCPQTIWKPSEEMLEALYRVIPENVMEKSEDEMLLDKLYQGLKYGRVLSRN